MTRSGRAVAALALAAGLPACAVGRQMLASPGDLADYRLVRVAASEGRRLYEAQRYLERHPGGAFSAEVRDLFDAEEPAWFEKAQTSRRRASDYLLDLPRGPHAAAARALLEAPLGPADDVETLILLADARRTEARLDREDARRKRVGEAVLAGVAALLEPELWGARLDALPASTRRVLQGAGRPSWGGEVHARRREDLFFVVPTPSGAEERDAEVTVQLWLEDGRVADGLVEGEDLLVRWAEASEVHVLDASAPADRKAAGDAAVERLGGALEATLPAAECAAPARAYATGELLRRECRGWLASLRMGDGPGAVDSLEIRGPARALPTGMR